MTATRVQDNFRGMASDVSTLMSSWWATFRDDPTFRRRVGRLLVYILVVLLPLHAGLVAIGVPSWWKELVLGVTLAIALTLPARTRFQTVDVAFAVYIALVILSAVVHRVTHLAELAPYFLYVPFGFVLPRLFTNTDQLWVLIKLGIASLLFNAAWMIGVHLGFVRVPNLLSIIGPSWTATGSLTGGALATATLYGVCSAVAWIAAAISRHHGRYILVAAVFTAAGAMSGERIALVGSGLGILLAAFVAVSKIRSRLLTKRLVIGISVCLATGLVIAVIALPRVLRASDSVRASRWEATIGVAIHNPLLGAGPGTTSSSRALRELGFADRADLINPPDNLIGTRVSENSILKVAAEIGIPGFFAFTVWLLSVLIRTGIARPGTIRRGGHELVGPAVVGFTIINGLTAANMESFIGASIFWLGIGMCRGNWDAPDTITGGARVYRPYGA